MPDLIGFFFLNKGFIENYAIFLNRDSSSLCKLANRLEKKCSQPLLIAEENTKTKADLCIKFKCPNAMPDPQQIDMDEKAFFAVWLLLSATLN